MRGFHEYVAGLERLAQGRDVPDPAAWRSRLTRCLNGEPGETLRTEDGSRVRRHGAYFTSAHMATRLAGLLPVDDGASHLYLDPTCGAGDLLLAVAKRLPLADTLTATLSDWGRSLSGYDICGDFVRLAKARLVLLASQRCRVRPDAEDIDLASAFPNIAEGDFLARSERPLGADVVIMNPPFGFTHAPDDCRWTRGRVTAAAVFSERAIQCAPIGARIVAILPEVLRSGTRYRRWRAMLATLGSTLRARPLGLFDTSVDVDVYLHDFIKGLRPQSSEFAERRNHAARIGGVGKRFSVRVGPVVPHRHQEIGTKARYIHARSLAAWGEHCETTDERRFSGRLFQPPFVAVRRTSRPDQKKRAVATLILGTQPVAVENHLIVLSPKDSSVHTCRELVSRLRSCKTDEWINRHIRCRHLTTAVIADMPWWRK